MDKIPFIPKLTKFLVCLDLYQGVRMTSLGLMVLWIIYAVVGFFKFATGLFSVVVRRCHKSGFIFHVQVPQSGPSSGAWLVSEPTVWWCGGCRGTTDSTSCPPSTSPSSTSSLVLSAESSTLSRWQFSSNSFKTPLY